MIGFNGHKTTNTFRRQWPLYKKLESKNIRRTTLKGDLTLRRYKTQSLLTCRCDLTKARHASILMSTTVHVSDNVQ